MNVYYPKLMLGQHYIDDIRRAITKMELALFPVDPHDANFKPCPGAIVFHEMVIMANITHLKAAIDANNKG